MRRSLRTAAAVFSAALLGVGAWAVWPRTVITTEIEFAATGVPQGPRGNVMDAMADAAARFVDGSTAAGGEFPRWMSGGCGADRLCRRSGAVVVDGAVGLRTAQQIVDAADEAMPGTIRLVDVQTRVYRVTGCPSC